MNGESKENMKTHVRSIIGVKGTGKLKVRFGFEECITKQNVVQILQGWVIRIIRIDIKEDGKVNLNAKTIARLMQMLT